MINNPPESLIVKIWQRLLLNGTDLTTERGKPLKIVYPGRVNDDRGADFRDAVIATSQGLIRGDIEVHVSSSAWQAHQHHQDPVYNRVILHVVLLRATVAKKTICLVDRLFLGYKMSQITIYQLIGQCISLNLMKLDMLLLGCIL